MNLERFSIRPFVQRLRVRFRRSASESRLLTYLAILGPGIIAANAGNDAGGQNNVVAEVAPRIAETVQSFAESR